MTVMLSILIALWQWQLSRQQMSKLVEFLLKMGESEQHFYYVMLLFILRKVKMQKINGEGTEKDQMCPK